MTKPMFADIYRVVPGADVPGKKYFKVQKLTTKWFIKKWRDYSVSNTFTLDEANSLMNMWASRDDNIEY